MCGTILFAEHHMDLSTFGGEFDGVVEQVLDQGI
jgi:hypothetical protein